MKFRSSIMSAIFTTTHFDHDQKSSVINDTILDVAGRTFPSRRRLFRSWRIHYRITRAALTRVISYGSVELAAQDTDLSFYILHHSEVLKEAAKNFALMQLHI